MKGRSTVKAFILIGYTSAFVSYIAPQLNDILLSPALPLQLKYTLDFIFWASTAVLIYFGMAGEKKMDERKVQEIRDSVREEERSKLRMEGLNPANPLIAPTNPPSNPSSMFGSNRIRVMFSGKAKVKLSALEDVEDMEIVIPEKTITPESETEGEGVTGEIDELLKVTPNQ